MKTLTSIIIDNERHAISDLEDSLAEIPMIIVLATFDNVREALNYLQTEGKVDIIFSDIHMPMLNGIDAGKFYKLYSTYLIYVTAYRDFAVDAIKLDADGYLMKPLSYIDVLEQVNKIMEKDAQKESTMNEHDFLVFKGGQKNSFFKVMTREIYFIEGLANYVKIHTTKGVYVTQQLMKEMESKLKEKKVFIRIAKSTIISLLFMEKIDGNVVYMHNKETFSVGIPYQKDFYKLIKARFGETCQ